MLLCVNNVQYTEEAISKFDAIDLAMSQPMAFSNIYSNLKNVCQLCGTAQT